ncbi:2-C-methyl-D-erythritol 4-phosphate cytidylyltransferase [Desulfohalobium retbaense]|uniref:Bifunctional enzyme IspD/IspF n=1 Tax=Desulfohalobium retbaense (strain ATCC 49708 / DSM 5692 / JCM 16813 / HR100) TaxID=485915 RepID=C8WYR9_DESRD|nr:2-C-methyl-D-erythritol 4-phosphate cytidylyltransferase [Desulfohalobium retbaense]ACV67835.1 2-C-methyl-D-erythritol 4-phosphate cytidylyltransferase [Desulfohalobium retbaense DSM 5692]
MSTWTIILAGGSGSRLAEATSGVKKQFLHYLGRPLLWHSAATFAAMPSIEGIVMVAPAEELETARALFNECAAQSPLGVPVRWTVGGRRRQDSSAQGLASLPAECRRVLIHDAARPFVSAPLTQRVLDALECFDGVVPGIPVTDTIKQAQQDLVSTTLPRHELFAIQTPQGFRTAALDQAHKTVADHGIDVTDDASMLEYSGGRVGVVAGERSNCKITTAEDLRMLTASPSTRIPCTGWGYDVHRYGAGRPMKLGGIPITNGPEIIAHSDGDVLLHALMDALLGCLGAGDIGEHFPDTDPRWDNANSSALLTDVLDWCRFNGLILRHVDMTVVCQTPKLQPWKHQIRKTVAALLGLAEHHCNLKATTEEGLGFTGHKEGIKAIVLVTGERETPTHESTFPESR